MWKKSPRIFFELLNASSAHQVSVAQGPQGYHELGPDRVHVVVDVLAAMDD
jgi:hypothetical protein